MSKFSSTLLYAACVVAATPVQADTVWLKNGDRLTGKITVFDGGKLLIETDYGGSIPVDWAKIATLQSDRELLVQRVGADDDKPVKSIQAAEPGKITLNGDSADTVELASIEQIIRPKPVIRDLTWKGNIDLAMDYKRAEVDTDDYNIDVKTQARHGDWRHNAEGGYNRETQDDIVTTDNWDAEYALDRFFGPKFFWQGRAVYKRDQIEELSRQRTLGTGPGYQFWDDELGAFSLTALVNRTDYEYDTGEKDNFYAGAMKWEYNRYLVGKTFELFSNGEVTRPLSGVADYSLDAEVGLRYKVTDWASLNMKAEKNQVSGAEGDLDETQYSIGFGVGW
jgi:hypothetical protein